MLSSMQVNGIHPAGLPTDPEICQQWHSATAPALQHFSLWEVLQAR